MKNLISLCVAAFLIGSIYSFVESQQRVLKEQRETISRLIGTKFGTGTSIAIIKTVDRHGIPVNVKPKSVVCLAERPNETLICRVEAVR